METAQQSKVPLILKYTIQRVAAIKSGASVKLLQDLQQRLEKTNHTHLNHEILALIKKGLQPK